MADLQPPSSRSGAVNLSDPPDESFRSAVGGNLSEDEVDEGQIPPTPVGSDKDKNMDRDGGGGGFLTASPSNLSSTSSLDEEGDDRGNSSPESSSNHNESSDEDDDDEVLVPATPDRGFESNSPAGLILERRNLSHKISTTDIAIDTPETTTIEKEFSKVSLDTIRVTRLINTGTATSSWDSGNGSTVTKNKAISGIEVVDLFSPDNLGAKTSLKFPSSSPLSCFPPAQSVPSKQLFSQNVFTFKQKGSALPLNQSSKHPTFVASDPPTKTSSGSNMSTSTPLLSNNRRQIKNVFEELDETGIAADENPMNVSSNNLEHEPGALLHISAAITEVITLSPLRDTNSRAYSSGSSRDQGSQDKRDNTDDIIIMDDDDVDNDIVEIRNSEQLPDIDEITSRLKKHHIEKAPLVKYLENPPTPNPFAVPKPRGRPQDNFVSMARMDDFKRDVYKSVKLLTEITENMPQPDDDHSDFITPRQLRTELYPHQVFGSKWMCWREQQYPGGGILADEMGLGKTIMAIAVILNGKNAANEDRENWFTPKNKRLVPSKATLVICPVGCIGQWETEVKTKARGLQVLMHHGPKRTESAALLSQNDVVLTTYPTLSSEVSKPDDDPRNNCRSPLLRIHWERVILDEGHIIRNPKTHAALAACRLNANHRWIVTGTPVHNRPEDLYSLVKFLQMSPFDDIEVWKFWIGTKKVLDGCDERLQAIGKAIILRRTKEEINADSSPNIPHLPPKYIEDVEVTLSESENVVYTFLFDYAKSVMKQFLDDQKDRQNMMQNAANNYVAGAMQRGRKKHKETVSSYSTILVLCVRLRQLAVLPYLIKTMLEDHDVDDSDYDDSYDPFNDPINNKNPVFEPGFKSAKIRAVLEQLKLLKLDAESRGEPMEKVIIVSQWTGFLDILAQHLKRRGFSYDQLDGRLKVAERSEVMTKFNTNPKRPQILLLSITAGGVGLNLTGANHVYFIEPQWNPQIEHQAQDRVHRFGQTKPVYIKRFICQSSFEQRVMEIQKCKVELAENLLNNTKKTQSAGLNVLDLKKLFDL